MGTPCLLTITEAQQCTADMSPQNCFLGGCKCEHGVTAGFILGLQCSFHSCSYRAGWSPQVPGQELAKVLSSINKALLLAALLKHL